MNKTIKMDPLLINVIGQESFNNFKVPELRDKYLSQKEGGCPAECRRYIYKQVLRLIKLGLLEKNGAKNSHNAVYKKTKMFHEVKLVNKEDQEPIIEEGLTTKVSQNYYSILEDKLKEYQVDMMSAIGESEEYIQLLNQFPDMKAELSENYHLARNRSSKLLGQIKAIKTMLSLREGYET
jgi:hypothetical protein